MMHTPTQVAQRLGVTPRTIQGWCHPDNTLVEHTRTVTGRILFTDAQVALLLEQRAPEAGKSRPEAALLNPLFADGNRRVVPIRKGAA